ncbi:MAG TPA: anti-sigma factor [Chloroflexota bacterium]|nr:anti-sigma factor [Chloroflexota bacterium]
MTEHTDYELEAYVLGALDESEQAQVDIHLRSCEQCRNQVSELQEVMSLLPFELAAAEPPADLRQRILGTAVMDAATPASVAPVAARREPQPPSRPSRWWRVPRPLTAVMVGAAAALVLVGVLIGRTTAGPSVSALSRYQQLAGRAAASGAVIRPFAPSGRFRGRLALAIRGAGHATLLVGPIPSPRKGDVYQLWFLNTLASARSGGVFTGAPGGAHALTVARPAAGFKLAAVTEEPGPHGARRPTSSPIMIAGL